jgi:hypothetical protein
MAIVMRSPTFSPVNSRFFLFVGQADFSQLVIAHGRGAMAAQTVIDEQLGAVLQRSHVVDAIGRVIELITTLCGD